MYLAKRWVLRTVKLDRVKTTFPNSSVIFASYDPYLDIKLERLVKKRFAQV